MAFGASPFGSSPFGSESTEDTLLSAGFSVTAVESIARDLVKVTLNSHAVMNAAYLDVSNYAILYQNGDVLPILKVLEPRNTDSIGHVLLQTRPQIEGSIFFVQVYNLVDRLGVTISLQEMGWQYIRTKTDAIMTSVPRVFDKTAISNMRALLNAVSIEDNTIGGAEKVEAFRPGTIPVYVEVPVTIDVTTAEEDAVAQAIMTAFLSLSAPGVPMDLSILATRVLTLTTAGFTLNYVNPNSPAEDELQVVGNITFGA